ncbi:MAG: formylmethanofuran dehydrogenase subunit E family protein [Candidatus Bathyarchaeia archaeon]
MGPFLVVGVRMGGVAKKFFNQDAGDSVRFQVTAKVPLVIPFSCTIDGIQAATSCTLGNQRLRIENTRKQIFASFRAENSDHVVRISVNPRVIRDLMRKMSAGIGNDELSGEIAAMPERQLFTIEKECALSAVRGW